MPSPTGHPHPAGHHQPGNRIPLARARRIGSPTALAAALAVLQPAEDTVVATRAAEWQEQLTALEEARQCLLEDRANWLAGEPKVHVIINII